jgi:tripartite-type tricarboxylate transporter receptor subunit TctC
MPAEVVAKLNLELRNVLADVAVRDKLRSQGADIVAGSPEAFARFIADEARKWARLLRQGKITVD